MSDNSTHKKVNIDQCIKKINTIHKQRLGAIGPPIGMILIILFAFALLPLYIFLIIFNRVYFWIRKQKPIDPKPYFNFDRHNLPHLRLTDKIWCEYCEWVATLGFGNHERNRKKILPHSKPVPPSLRESKKLA